MTPIDYPSVNVLSYSTDSPCQKTLHISWQSFIPPGRFTEARVVWLNWCSQLSWRYSWLRLALTVDQRKRRVQLAIWLTNGFQITLFSYVSHLRLILNWFNWTDVTDRISKHLINKRCLKHVLMLKIVNRTMRNPICSLLNYALRPKWQLWTNHPWCTSLFGSPMLRYTNYEHTEKGTFWIKWS